jgi:hypothetical protein
MELIVYSAVPFYVTLTPDLGLITINGEGAVRDALAQGELNCGLELQ